MVHGFDFSIPSSDESYLNNWISIICICCNNELNIVFFCILLTMLHQLEVKHCLVWILLNIIPHQHSLLMPHWKQSEYKFIMYKLSDYYNSYCYLVKKKTAGLSLVATFPASWYWRIDGGIIWMGSGEEATSARLSDKFHVREIHKIRKKDYKLNNSWLFRCIISWSYY